MSRTRSHRKHPDSLSAPDLQFPSGELSGFTAAGIAGFQNLNPAAVVRELLQNSLDAAREAGRDVARVRFELDEHRLDDVPGIRAFRKAFRSALRDQQEGQANGLPSQAEVVTRAIDDCLQRPCRSLFVLDNGIGLDEQRMHAVLADGCSVKTGASAGAFGNGHFVVMPASDLRYVLYGGRTDGGRIIGAGHAILASHYDDRREARGKDGYFVSRFTDRLFDRFEFASGPGVPAYIRRRLDWIGAHWAPGGGAVVCVPGFNDFRDEKTEWWAAVMKAAACNFFPAIASGELIVATCIDGDDWVLDADAIPSILAMFSEEKRSRFLSGSRACGVFAAMREGHAMVVPTDAGAIPIRLQETPEDGVSRIDLCRNGMWITDDIPRLGRYRFSEHTPFHCVMLLDAEAGAIHDLVRKAEGPLHNHLEARKWLSREERHALEAAMDDVAQAIMRRIPKHAADVMPVSDVLVVNTPGIAPGERRSVVAGRFLPVPPPARHDAAGDEHAPDPEPWDPHDPEKKKRWDRERTRPGGRPMRFRALALPTAPRACRVDLHPDEGCPDSEIRFALDESLDESCDRPGGEAWVTLRRVTLDGEPVPETSLTAQDDDGGALGVILGALVTGRRRRLEFEFALPAHVEVRDDATVVLITQIFRRARSAAARENKDA